MNIDKVDYSKYLYTNSNNNVFSISAIVKETRTHYILKKETKVSKKNGLVVGSKGQGRFGWTTSVYYHPLTEEVYKQYLLQCLINKVTNFPTHYNINITEINYDEVKKAYEELTSYFIKKELAQ